MQQITNIFATGRASTAVACPPSTFGDVDPSPVRDVLVGERANGGDVGGELRNGDFGISERSGGLGDPGGPGAPPWPDKRRGDFGSG